MTLRHRSGVSARPYQLAVICSLLCACFIAWGCQTTPISGRRKLALITSPEPQEIKLGEEAYEQILSKEQPSKNQNSESSPRTSRTHSACPAVRSPFTKASFRSVSQKPDWQS